MKTLIEKPYEYYLKYWGQILDAGWVERELGIGATDFWFDSAEARAEFKAALAAVAQQHGVRIAFAEYEGCDVRQRTVAHMIFDLPDGRAVPFTYDFGYGYPYDSARFTFTDGNYSCDCNRSLFISESYPDVAELECGELITVRDFSVRSEAP